MGGGSYSLDNRAIRSSIKGYATASINETFTRKSIDNAMNPKNISIRESRDSDEHPESIAIILGLDHTGSMGKIPHHLVKEGLPHMMGKIIEKGCEHPQVLFLGIGDHLCDNAPLQVGQFESNDELLDKWLTELYLEGNGGGNGGESYSLAWYFAANHTSIDCFEKRKQKGFLFTVGDEPVHHLINSSFLKSLMGDGEYSNQTAEELFKKASNMYNVYHLHTTETMTGSRAHVINGWKTLIGNNLILVDNHKDIANIIADTIIKHNIKKENPTIIKNKQEIIL